MFKKAIDKAKRMAADRVPFDPSALNDSVAMQTDWTPVEKGGASFQTHKLVAVNSNRIEFRVLMAIKLSYLIFLLAGIAMITGGFYAMLSSEAFSLTEETFVAFFLGLIFAALGGSLLRFGTASIVFDQRRGYFWKGRKAPDEILHTEALENFAKLEQIHALQLISEYCRSDKTSHYSFELNIVLKDGSRINVVDHGNQKKLRDDATALSEFLGKPVWDAI